MNKYKYKLKLRIFTMDLYQGQFSSSPQVFKIKPLQVLSYTNRKFNLALSITYKLITKKLRFPNLGDVACRYTRTY